MANFALLLHEFATNAAKYGALSTENGHLRLVWTIDDEALVVEWIETGGPPAVEPKSLGFGLSIVRQLAHIVDSLICYIGYLFPLWDAKRQTLADKIMTTVCLPV